MLRNTGRNQLSVDAKNSQSVSPRLAVNVAPFGTNLSRWIRLFAGSQINVLPRNASGNWSAVYTTGLQADVMKPPGTNSVEGKRWASGPPARRVVRSTRHPSNGLMRWTLHAGPWSGMSSVTAGTARAELR